MTACFDVAKAGAPVAAPLTAGACRVICAEYSPTVMVVAFVMAVNPSIALPAATGFVAVQVRLGVSGTSTGKTSG